MSKKITLSSNRKIAGVCGGVAEYLGIDPTIVRIIWLVLVFGYGFGLIAYLLCWLLFPKA